MAMVAQIPTAVSVAPLAPPIGIVVVSDLHAGPEHPFADLSIGKQTLTGEAFSRDALTNAVKEIVGSIDPSRRLLVCAGDISTSCDSAEIVKAGQFLTAVADTLEVPQGQRFVVPGNHDIDWKLTALGVQDAWYDGLRQRKFEELVRKHAVGFAFCSSAIPEHVELASLGIDIFLLDSPGEDRHDQKPHRGLLGSAQLDRLKDQLSRSRQAIKVVVLHHHVAPMRRDTDPEDYSTLNDAHSLLEILEQHDVQLIIHGHQHRPFIRALSRPASSMVVLGAGSTTAWHRLPRETKNAFHVIVAEDLTGKLLGGHIHTRLLKGTHGWTLPSFSSDSLVGRKPFGEHPSPTNINALIADAIADCSRTKIVYLGRFLSKKLNGARLCEHDFGQLIHRELRRTANSQFRVVHDPERDTCQLQATEGAE